MQFDRRLYQALLRNDFRAFTEKVFLTLNPGESFVWSWYFDAVAWQLERVRRGETKRLIINLPPRSLKSIMASVAWPAFILGLDPSKRIICVSYSAYSTLRPGMVKILRFHVLFGGYGSSPTCRRP
jgi:hypothetical protein